MKPIFLSWRPKSEQGRLLAAELGATFVFRDNYNHVKPNKKQVVINWGNGGLYFPWRKEQWKSILNKPEAVATAVGKIDTFIALKRKKIPTPEWTTSPQRALAWINAGGVVFARSQTEGNNGRGIRIYHLKKNKEYVTINDLRGIPLFTKGFPDDKTYRAFVFNGKVDRIYVVDEDDEYQGAPSRYIRNHKNGWVFYDCRKSILRPAILSGLGKAVRSLGLDFGAVDFGVAKDKKRWAIYEINSAFGGEREDAQLNARAMRRAFKELRK